MAKTSGIQFSGDLMLERVLQVLSPSTTLSLVLQLELWSLTTSLVLVRLQVLAELHHFVTVSTATITAFG